VVNVEYHDDLKEVQSDAQLARLLSHEQTAPFDRLEWWRLLAEHCSLKPKLAVARDGAHVAVLALSGEGRHLTQLSNWYTFRFRAIVSDGAEPLLAPLARDLARKARRVTLSGLPTADADLLASAFATAGWCVSRTQTDVNHVLPLDECDFAAYLATRPGKLRTTLKRKSGKVVTRVLTHFDAQVWAQYEAIYAESWKPEEGSPAFLRAFAQAEGAAGRLRLAVAHAADDPHGPAVAAQMWTVEGGTAFIHKLAHRESAKPLSPGSVLSAALFRHVIDIDKVTLVDFGTGDDPYKRDWMEETRPRWRLDMLRPQALANWPILIRQAVMPRLRALAATAKRS
jgi:CelD/BcsL family acetyltransferase involved in cellulose biosynthesis